MYKDFSIIQNEIRSYEIHSAQFEWIPNDYKEVTDEQRITLGKRCKVNTGNAGTAIGKKNT